MDIFNAVRSGDTTKVVYLVSLPICKHTAKSSLVMITDRAISTCNNIQVEEQHVSLQQRDDWDATPLYYASFTGNQELVKYLLGKGATCEEKVRCP